MRMPNKNDMSKKILPGATEHVENNDAGGIKPFEEQHFIDSSKPVWNYSLLTDADVDNFQKRHPLFDL